MRFILEPNIIGKHQKPLNISFAKLGLLREFNEDSALSRSFAVASFCDISRSWGENRSRKFETMGCGSVACWNVGCHGCKVA
jgi:hypothetical protein